MIVDRLDFAKKLCNGKKVVDIGGSRMYPIDRSVFDLKYLDIQKSALTYTIIDKAANADINIDLNYPYGLSQTLLNIEAEVVLCMETLEHLKNPGLLCDEIRKLVNYGATAYITLPIASIFYRYIEKNGLGNFWHKCHHLYSFPDYNANIFIKDNFEDCNIEKHYCLGKYSKLWPLVWVVTGGKGLSQGFLINKRF